jgi:hypothetical protein
MKENMLGDGNLSGYDRYRVYRTLDEIKSE